MKTFLLLILIGITLEQQQQQQQQQQLHGQQYVNRIECKSEPERETTYYILNCTLVNNGKLDEQPQLTQQQQQQQQQLVSKTSIEITSSDGLKVGLAQNWKTPWDEIQLNYDIIKHFIWKSSRISYIGELTF